MWNHGAIRYFRLALRATQRSACFACYTIKWNKQAGRAEACRPNAWQFRNFQIYTSIATLIVLPLCIFKTFQLIKSINQGEVGDVKVLFGTFLATDWRRTETFEPQEAGQLLWKCTRFEFTDTRLDTFYLVIYMQVCTCSHLFIGLKQKKSLNEFMQNEWIIFCIECIGICIWVHESLPKISHYIYKELSLYIHI